MDTLRLALAAALVCVAPLAAGFGIGLPQYAGATELYNEHTGHYVLIGQPEELQAVLGGSAGPGWRRTGYSILRRVDNWDPLAATLVPVCRFYAPGPNSHFHTTDAAECESLKRPGSGWIYEGEDFKVFAAVHGACPVGAPVYRLYNNRWMFNDSNHRYTQDERVRARMVARGWIDEGVRFCSEPMQERALQAEWLATSDHLAALNLPAFARAVDKNANDVPWAINPDYPLSADAVSGWAEWWGRLMTTSATLDPSSVQRSSFVHVAAPGFYPGTQAMVGFHVAGRERTAEVAALGLRKRLDPGPRLPWAAGGESDVLAMVWIPALGKVARDDGHAYAFYAIDLRDTASGLPLRVTLQMLGTQAPGDFAGRADDGTVIVSTAFADNPGFGKAVQGRYVACASGCSVPAYTGFRFRIGLDDMREIAARARRVDARFSADAANYQVEGFECRAETYRDAELGITLHSCMLGMTY